jgi:hypothetical protein
MKRPASAGLFIGVSCPDGSIMEGCALFVVICVAGAALAVALLARSRANESRQEVARLEAQVSSLWRALRELRDEHDARAHDARTVGMAHSAAGSSPIVKPAPGVPEPVVPDPVVPDPVEPEPVVPLATPPFTPDALVAPMISEGSALPPQTPIEELTPPVLPVAADGDTAFPSHVPPPPPPPPSAPSPAPRLPWSFDWENLVGIKLFSWIAGIALVLAAVFFLKHSVEHGWLSPTIRATLGLISGAGLLVICELRVARNYKITANALHGAGIAILYATLFSIYALWHLLPSGVVFFLMLVVTAVAVGLSLRRDSIFIALLGLMGGFATPALLSSGENRPIELFSYLLLLNLGLAWVAWRKRWPALTIGSVVFTVLYQWAWVGRYLTASQLPLAAAIFIVFAASGAALLWMRRDDDGQQRIFDRIGLAAAALPLAFGVFSAAIPAYGLRYNTLFGFLLLIAAGVSFVAVVQRQFWLHTAGAATVVLTFAIWIVRSFTPLAWPALLAWITAFVALYLIVAMRHDTEGNFAAPLLFFLLPALIAVEPRTSAPALLFGTFFILLAAVAFVAVRSQRGLLYFVASFFVIVGEGAWSARHLTPERLYAALLLYGSFGLLFLAVPLLTRRLNRPLLPRGGASITIIVSVAMLFFLTIDSVAGAALWGLTLLLGVLLLGAIFEARLDRRPLFAVVTIVLTWVVLGSWWEGVNLEHSLLPALFAIAAFGVLSLAGTVAATRGDQSGEFEHATHLALGGHLFLLYVASQASLAFPPWPLFAVLALLTIALGTASLYLRRATLTIGAAAAGQIVLFVWTWHRLLPPWGNTALAATLLLAGWGLSWYLLAGRRPGVSGSELVLFRHAAVIGLLLGHLVAIGAGIRAQPALFTTLLATHMLLAVATLVLAARSEEHALALVSVIMTTLGIAAARTTTPAQAFVFALLPYLLSIAYPFVLGSRVKRSLYPHLAAVAGSIAFFFFAREAMGDARLGSIIGILPVGQAAILGLLLYSLLRYERSEGAWQPELGRLALVAGAVLAFVTVAVPLQLEKQWITIGWGLEGAALVWLFRRIPHRGLLAWAAVLLAAVFVRLTLNPAVLSYHAPGERAIFNWYLYTYLVAALAFFAAAYWLPRDGRWKRAIAAAGTMGTILLFLLLNIEIADFFSTGPVLTFNFLSSSLAQDLTYTMGWAAFAVALLITGLLLRTRAVRVAALMLLLVTILKCFLHDLARLGGLYRVGSLLGLALSLVAVGVLLQRFVMSKPPRPEAEEPAV